MANIKLELQPFQVPTHVTVIMPAGSRQGGMIMAPTIALEDLSDEALEALIDEFATSVRHIKESAGRRKWANACD